MHPRSLLLVGLVLIATSSANAQRMEAGQLVTPFSAAKPGKALPEGWSALFLGSLKTPTDYRLRRE